MTPTTPARVLWLTKGLGPGGAEHLLLALASALDTERVHCQVAYLLPWKQHLVAALEARGVTTHLLDGPREADPRWARRLRRLLVDGRFDVLHAHSPYPAAIARLVARSLPRGVRPRFVYTEHNVWHSYRPLTRALGRLTYGLDDARLAVAEEVRSSLPTQLRKDTEALVHGIEVSSLAGRVDARAATRAALGVAEQEKVVLTVANLRADKDYPNLLRAAARVIREVPDVRFVIAGQGPLENDIRELAAAPELRERVELLGHRTDVPDLLAAADVVAIASRHEGLPVVVMEALAVGRPIVGTAVGGIPELVRDGVEGLLVAPADPLALADAIVAVLRDDGRRAAMAAAAATRSALVDVGRAARRHEELYRSLAAPQ